MAGILLQDLSKAIIYRPPTTARNAFGMYMKTESFAKGTYPITLKPYMSKFGAAKIATHCAGNKGQKFRLCLITQASKAGLTKTFQEKEQTKRAYENRVKANKGTAMAVPVRGAAPEQAVMIMP